MIIDNPQVMRRLIGELAPRFTNPGAEEIYTVKESQMDAYAAKWGKYADRVWEEEYLSCRLPQQPECHPTNQFEADSRASANWASS
jgi:hypothetical protein